MPASDDAIRTTVEQYLALVADGTAEQIADLYADGATVEDPVGTAPLTTREEILGFYGNLAGVEARTELHSLRIAAGEAAFSFTIETKVGDSTFTVSPIDVMTFDDQGKVTSMRAFWAKSDLTAS